MNRNLIPQVIAVLLASILAATITNARRVEAKTDPRYDLKNYTLEYVQEDDVYVMHPKMVTETQYEMQKYNVCMVAAACNAVRYNTGWYYDVREMINTTKNWPTDISEKLKSMGVENTLYWNEREILPGRTAICTISSHRLWGDKEADMADDHAVFVARNTDGSYTIYDPELKWMIGNNHKTVSAEEFEYARGGTESNFLTCTIIM